MRAKCSLPMQFVDVEAARAASGLRLVVAGGIPSPWSEAAKGVFHVKKVPFLAVRGRSNDEALGRWLPGTNFPVALLDGERPRTGWAEILALAERLAPEPPLVPEDDTSRVLALGLCHEIMDEGGLLWSTRLRAIDAGLTTEGREGFPLRVAKFLAPRYGWAEGKVEPARARAFASLRLLDAQLERSGGPYYLGRTMSAVDVYSAAALGALSPLSEEDCPMIPLVRPAFEWMQRDLGDAVTPRLLRHRDAMYRDHLELPIRL